MKKVLSILLLLIGCSKPPPIIYNLIKGIKDTTIYAVWDGHGKVLSNYKIHGTGTLQDWIIQAPYESQVFDTSINLVNVRTFNNVFSAIWYGASSESSDNYTALQKSIDQCKNSYPLYIPTGQYKYSKPLKAFTIYKGNYTATKLDMYGDGDIWSDATTLIYTGTNDFAFGIQLAKGGSLRNIKFQGQFEAPANNGLDYYKLTLDTYTDVLGKCGKGYSGIVIDYDASLNNGGSTGFKVSDTWVTGFDVLYNVSPNGKTFNADILQFNSIRCGNGRIGFQSGQAQEKGNSINYIASWGNIHTLISIGKSGKYQAGNYSINEGNIAGNCIQLFDVSLSGWNPFYVKGLTVEGIARLGIIWAWTTVYAPPVSLSNMDVRYALKSQAGEQVLLSTNAPHLQFSNCALWYYNGSIYETQIYRGRMVFNNCDFGGNTVDNPQAIFN